MTDKNHKARSSRKAPSERRGLYTSGVVSRKDGRDIALFFSGKEHAGENLTDVLRRRADELDAPIQMCDALSRNLPGELKVILANCLAHSRRRFVEVVASFPGECRYVLETLGEVYKHDAISRDLKMSPEERLQFHQEKSRPLMEELDRWMVWHLGGVRSRLHLRQPWPSH
jgi:hypothetical protein